MRIIKKTGLINNNVVPRQPWNATTFFSQRTTHCFSHSGNTMANQNNTNIPNLIPFIFSKSSSNTLDITVSYKRQNENKICFDMSISGTKVLYDLKNFYPAVDKTEFTFIKNFVQGSGNYFSVSVEHNLGWLYRGNEKAYFSGLCM